jgi:hypothetical protein
MDNDLPAVKPWGIDDKQYLQGLIDRSKVDITRTEHDYIDRVRQKYFRQRNKVNFRRNFKNYARSRELEDEISGARRLERGIVF